MLECMAHPTPGTVYALAKAFEAPAQKRLCCDDLAGKPPKLFPEPPGSLISSPRWNPQHLQIEEPMLG